MGSKRNELAPEPGAGKFGSTVEAHLDETGPVGVSFHAITPAGERSNMPHRAGEEDAAAGRLVDWVARAGLAASHVAGASVCAHHRGVGVPPEWLGQAQQSPAGHRE